MKSAANKSNLNKLHRNYVKSAASIKLHRNYEICSTPLFPLVVLSLHTLYILYIFLPSSS